MGGFSALSGGSGISSEIFDSFGVPFGNRLFFNKKALFFLWKCDKI